MGEEHRQTTQRTRRGFTKEFMRDAVELVRSSGRTGALWASRSTLGPGRAALASGGQLRVVGPEAFLRA